MNSDKDLEKVIIKTLKSNGSIDSSGIDVSVKRGAVNLNGDVSTYSEKIRAECLIENVTGIHKVVNNLEVSFPASFEPPDDNEIKIYISASLRGHCAINSSSIKIDVKEGHVTLKGKINALWKQRKIEDYASSVLGVVSVDNQIEVDLKEKISDEDIKKAVESAIDASVRVDLNDINIEVEKGVVTLSGTVKDHNASEAAEEAAVFTRGVLQVINDTEWVLRYSQISH